MHLSEKRLLSTFKVQLFIVQNLSKTFSCTRHFMAVQIGSPLGNRVTTFSRTLLEGREKECEFFQLHGFTWWNRDIWVKSNGGRQASEDESKKCRRMPFHFFSTLSELIGSESKGGTLFLSAFTLRQRDVRFPCSVEHVKPKMILSRWVALFMLRHCCILIHGQYLMHHIRLSNPISRKSLLRKRKYALNLDTISDD